jgi:hypothetical protein
MNIDMGDPRSQGSKKASETQHRDISVISLKKSWGMESSASRSLRFGADVEKTS